MGLMVIVKVQNGSHFHDLFGFEFANSDTKSWPWVEANKIGNFWGGSADGCHCFSQTSGTEHYF